MSDYKWGLRYYIIILIREIEQHSGRHSNRMEHKIIG